MSAETAAVLRVALERITDERCWIKGQNQAVIDGRDCYCSAGAIGSAARSGFSFDEIFHAEEALERIVGTDLADYIDWNDAPERTHSEVVAGFESAIAAEEASA